MAEIYNFLSFERKKKKEEEERVKEVSKSSFQPDVSNKTFIYSCLLF